MQKFLSDKQIAEALSVCRATVWRMTADGRLPQPVKIGGTTRWRADEVQEALSAHA
jgi:excisionase family DNA binding protein